MELTDQRDTIKWSFNKNGIYTVKSYYRLLIENGVKYPHNFMWKAKMPPRVKVFMWLMLRNIILTKDNLLKRGWLRDKKCPFCMHDESIDNFFFAMFIC